MCDYAGRTRRVQVEMRKRGVDLLFLRPSPDLTYLTGFRLVPYSPGIVYDERVLPESWLFGAWVFEVGEPVLTVPERVYTAIGGSLRAGDVRVAGDAATATTPAFWISLASSPPRCRACPLYTDSS